MAGTNARYWVAIGYPENMIDSWQEDIGDLLEVPYAYCIHDKDKLLHDIETTEDHDERKTHVHIIIAFNNTTTYKHALNTFRRLNKVGFQAFNTCQNIINIRSKYNYLIHDTDECRKKGKYQYSPSERILGNNFDIGLYEQISLEERKKVRREISMLVVSQEFTNYYDLYVYVSSNYDSLYEDVVCSNSGHFERLCKGLYLKHEQAKKSLLEKLKG